MATGQRVTMVSKAINLVQQHAVRSRVEHRGLNVGWVGVCVMMAVVIIHTNPFEVIHLLYTCKVITVLD